MNTLSKLMELHRRQEYNKAFQLAKEYASNDDQILYFLGGYYERGLGTPIDYEMARICYYKSATSCAKNGHAMYFLGRLYERGLGVNCNIREAIKWYRRGAHEDEQRCFEALDRLGVDLGSYFDAWQD